MVAANAGAVEPISEAELLGRYLSAPTTAAALHASTARTRAQNTSTSLFRSPTLDARHEEARGPAGASIDALGASLTVDLGLAALGETRAAHLRGEAGQHHRRLVALTAACSFRSDLVDLWAAEQTARITQTSQVRLTTLQDTEAARAASGESSGYERDRTALAVMTHATAAADRLGTLERLRAEISAHVGGEEVLAVRLAPYSAPLDLSTALSRLPTHPALAALTLEREADETSSEAARRAQLPDLTFSGGARWDAPPTGGVTTQGYELGGSILIPWTDGSRAEARTRAADAAESQARLSQASTQLEASLRGAHRRVASLQQSSMTAVEVEPVWSAARERYAAGETSLDDLLQVAAAVEAADLALMERERLLREALLELSCAAGQFTDPILQSTLEETLR